MWRREGPKSPPSGVGIGVSGDLGLCAAPELVSVTGNRFDAPEALESALNSEVGTWQHLGRPAPGLSTSKPGC